MKLYINVKQIKKRGNRIAACPYEPPTPPETLRQLITMLVSDSVEGYRQRLLTKEDTRVLTQEVMDDMSLVGKIGFGIPFGSQQTDLGDALETAFQGFEDGLYRLFVGELEIESLDAPLHLQEEDTVTIIRLVMLTGGFF